MKFDPKEKTKHTTFKCYVPGGPWVVEYIDMLGITLAWCNEGGEWLEFDIRPFPYSELPVQRGMADVISIQKKEFVYCLVGWRGLTNDNGDPLPCDDESKNALFNHHKSVRDFVLECIDELHVSIGAAIKN